MTFDGEEKEEEMLAAICTPELTFNDWVEKSMTQE